VRPYLEKTHHKKGRVAQSEGPEFKSQYHKKKRKKFMTHLVLSKM
jgi:hypothetical protein